MSSESKQSKNNNSSPVSGHYEVTVDGTASNNRKKGPMKILLGIIIGLVVLAVVVVLGFIIYMRSTYAGFYSLADKEFDIPGTSEGFVPQDLAYIENDGSWLFSGYDGNGSSSPIYRKTAEGSSLKMYVRMPDGGIYQGHGGGITADSETVFLTTETGYLTIGINDVLNAANGDYVQAKESVDLGIVPAFINIIDGNLYTGVFYYEGKFDTPDEMHLTAPGGQQNFAVMYMYEPTADEPFGYSTTPAAVYSIPDKVQGVAKTPEGDFVFSTSWGLDASKMLVYDSSKLEMAGFYDIGENSIPLYFFDDSNQLKYVDCPPMSEGIICHDGKIYIANESASNKYFFGKLIDGQVVYAIQL